MEFILFITVVILVFWVKNLSSRVDKLEQLPLRKNVVQESFETKIKPAPISTASHKRSVFNGDDFSNQKASVYSAMPEMQKNAPSSVMIEKIQEPIKTKSKDEDEIATNWLNKIGVVAVLLGMAFFFKYAVDQNWISPLIRIIMGFSVGALFIILGWLWKTKYEKYADVMIGGGIGIWYFTIFAMYVFYALVPQFVALGLMVVAAASSIGFAVKRKSLALAALGLIGAYGAPVFLGVRNMNQIQFFVYLSVINIVLVATLTKNFWSSLVLFGVIATWFDLSIWFSWGQGAQNIGLSLGFLMLFLFVYLVGIAGMIQNHQIKKTLPVQFIKTTSITILIAVLVYISFVYTLISNLHHDWLIWAGLFGSATAFLAYAIIDRLEFEGINYTLSLAGSAFLLLAWNWQWEKSALALAIIISGIVGAGIAASLKRKEIRLWSTFVILIGLVATLFLKYGDIKLELFVFNSKFGLMLLETAALFFAAWLYKFTEAKEFEKNSDKLLAFLGVIFLWGAVSMDINHFFKTLNGQYGLALWWIIYPLALAGIGAFFKKPGLLKLSLLFSAFGLIRCFMLPYPAEGANFIFNFKFGLMALETASIFILAKCLEQVPEDDTAKKAGGWVVVFGALLLWLMVSVDVFGTFAGLTKLYVVALWWIIYPVMLIYFAFLQKNEILSKLAMLLMVIGFFRVLFLDYDPLVYVFMFNAKFGLMVLEVLAVLSIAKYLPENSEKTKTGDMLKVVASLLLWFAFSLELFRFYNKPEDSNTRNLFMSLWWIIYATALITIGAVLRSLIFRKIALALFGVSIVKVFLYDALSLEMGYRIVSFIVLGVILLSVSFAYQKNKEKIKKFLEGEGGENLTVK